MTIEKVYVIPHGDEILDMPNTESVEMHDRVAQMTDADRSDIIVIISPHGLRLQNKVSIVGTQKCGGYYKTQKRKLRRMYNVDQQKAIDLASATKEYSEIVSFITSSGPHSIFPMDFGTMIPLGFFKTKRTIPMGQPRPENVEGLVEFGRLLKSWASNQKENISIVISADQAHTHSTDGPYGYSDTAKEYDELVQKCIAHSDLKQLMSLKKDFLESAKPDSYWNMAILYGILHAGDLRMKFVYYYVQVYFGMLAAVSV